MIHPILSSPRFGSTKQAWPMVWAWALCFWSADPCSQAANLTVDSLADAMAMDGVCTLREAISAANHNADFLDCTGTGGYGNDLITIAVPGTIEVALSGDHEDGNQTGDFDITDSLTIVGLGPGGDASSTTIDAKALDRVFDVHFGDFTVEGMTIREGKTPTAPKGDPEGCGGGILLRAPLTFEILDCVIEDSTAVNRGGGISILGAYPQCRIERCTFRRNQALEETGGGFHNQGYEPTIEIVDSSFEENWADEGGGFFSNVFHTNLTVRRTSFSQNEGLRNGGGLSVIEWGNARVHISDATFTNNTSDRYGGLLFEFTQLEWDPPFSASVTVENTLFSENETRTENGGAVAFRPAQMYGATVTSATFLRCRFERNQTRFGGGALFNNLSKDSTFEFIDCAFVGNHCLLGGGGAILNTGANTEFVMSEGRFIENTAYGLFGSGGALFNTAANMHLVMSNGRFIGNSAPLHGGAICSNAPQSRLDLVGMTFRDNHTERGEGGAISLAESAGSHASLAMEYCAVESCSSGGCGGGVSVMAGLAEVDIRSCTFDSNEAVESGGGVHLGGQPQEIAIETSVFNGNLASYDGGGIANQSETGHLGVSHCVLRNNRSLFNGGGFHEDGRGASVEIEDCTIEANACGEAGGGCRFGSGVEEVLVSGCLIRDNTAAKSGAGIAVQLDPDTADKKPLFARCAIQRNRALRYGGGVFSGRVSEVRLVNCGLFENQAAGGGGVTCFYSQPELTNCSLWGNRANGLGDGIYATSDAGLGCLNSILWNNGTEITANPNGSPSGVRYSCVQGGWAGEGNIAEDPRFVDPATGDYHLEATSPCIDKGDADPLFNDGVRPPGEGGARNDMGIFGGPYNLTGRPASSDSGPIHIVDSVILENVSLGNGGGVYVSTTELSAESEHWNLYE